MAQLIVLNGTSSSGKTSLAVELQKQLPELWLNFSIDSVLYALPEAELGQMISGTKITRPGYDYSNLVAGYNRALMALLSARNNVISDNALTNEDQKLEIQELTESFSSVWIGVECDLDILKTRERARGDRAIGTAEREFPLVHKSMAYDLTVDTSYRSAAEIADEIVELMK